MGKDSGERGFPKRKIPFTKNYVHFQMEKQKERPLASPRNLHEPAGSHGEMKILFS